jgi:hypothetical protein
MSQTITNAFIQQFNRNVYILSQQMGSKLRGTIREETVHAKKAFFDRLAPAQRPQVKISRHQDTPLTEQVHSRRSVDLIDYVLADLVDREDQIRMLINPDSLYASNFARTFGREFDYAIINALTADSDSGQFGGTPVALPAGNTIASGGLGLTISRVRQIKRIFDSKDVMDEGRVFVVSAQAMEDLLENTEVTSSDFNTVKALVQGTIEGDMWMGFKWVRVSDDILPIDGSLDRSCFAYQRDGMAFAIGQDLRTEMDRRADKMNSLQVMTTASFNAVRIDEDTVLEVLVREV